jgi:hypothetical protein
MTETKWKMDRSIPVALILAVLIQSGGVIWWASGLSKDAETSKDRILKLEQSQVTAERVGRIEEQNARTREDLTEIKADIKRLLDKKS